MRTLEAHAERVLLSPVLMHTTWPALLAKLQATPEYRAAFATLYPGRLTPAHVLDALTASDQRRPTVDAGVEVRASLVVAGVFRGDPLAPEVRRRLQPGQY